MKGVDMADEMMMRIESANDRWWMDEALLVFRGVQRYDNRGVHSLSLRIWISDQAELVDSFRSIRVQHCVVSRLVSKVLAKILTLMDVI